MMFLGALYESLRGQFGALEARIMIKERVGAAFADIVARPDTPIAPKILALIEGDVALRAKGTPLARIYGVRGFWKGAFTLSPDTLEPRPDTETLIQAALAGPQPQRLLDLGTGTGCIILSLLQEWPNTWGLATDKSPGAVATAQKNAHTLGVSDRVAFMCGNWGAALAPQSFDLIVSNPPYIKEGDIAGLAPEVRCHDPLLALDGGEDGLMAYRKIIVDIKNLLRVGGRAFLEMGYGQATDIGAIAEGCGLKVLAIYKDLGGIQRILEINHGDKL